MLLQAKIKKAFKLLRDKKVKPVKPSEHKSAF